MCVLILINKNTKIKKFNKFISSKNINNIILISVLQSYPDESHGLSSVRHHVYQTISAFLMECFQKKVWSQIVISNERFIYYFFKQQTLILFMLFLFDSLFYLIKCPISSFVNKKVIITSCLYWNTFWLYLTLKKTIPVILKSYYTYKILFMILIVMFSILNIFYTRNTRVINFMYSILFLMCSFYVSLKKMYRPTSKLLTVI